MNPMYVLALMSLALIGGASAGDKELLEQLCDRKAMKDAAAKGELPEVTHASQVKNFATLIRSDASVKCSVEIEAAILRLAEVVELENVCSSKAADVIVAFWHSYASSYAMKHRNLPKPLKTFFLGFGLQVSKQCKQTMISQLAKVTKEKGITKQDIRIVAEPVIGKLIDVFGETRVDNLLQIILASRYEKVQPKAVKMEPAALGIYNILRERCTKKFQPIYDTLIAPIFRLSAIGINYHGESVAKQMADFESEEIYKTWFAAVLACESTALIYPVDVPKTVVNDNGDKVSIRSLDEEDYKLLEDKTGVDLRNPKRVPVIRCRIEPVQVNDLVLDKTDEYLINAVAKHASTLGGITKFRVPMLRKTPQIAKLLIVDSDVKAGSISKEEDSPTKLGRA